MTDSREGFLGDTDISIHDLAIARNALIEECSAALAKATGPIDESKKRYVLREARNQIDTARRLDQALNDFEIPSRSREIDKLDEWYGRTAN